MIKPVNSVLFNRIKDLKNKKIASLLSGDYKAYKQSCREFAKEAVKDYEFAKSVPSMQIRNLPLFSKTGLKILKVMVLKLFTKLTAEEKALNRMLNNDKFLKK